MVKLIVKSCLKSLGYKLTRIPPETREVLAPDVDPENWAILSSVTEYTQTNWQRLNALIEAVRYVHQNQIPGAFVECGVWRGGSMMSVAKMLLHLEAADRLLYLFDTFEGMPDPIEVDVDLKGKSGQEYCDTVEGFNRIPLDEVVQNMSSTGYPQELMRFVKGKVEDTLPESSPSEIALLRLDTDWYESTKQELEHLYPRVVEGGVIIIDDYGHFKGCRQAVDEYWSQLSPAPYLNRIDYTGRLAIRP